jgi:hypothetical protein
MGTQQASVVVDDMPALVAKRNLGDAPRRTLPPQDDITKALDADEYFADYRFDWARERLYRIGTTTDPTEGPRLTFSRYYWKIRVVVDLIAADNDKNRALVKMKQDLIHEYNVAHKDSKIGYLPILPYQKITRANFDSVKDGQILNLRDRIEDPRDDLERGYVK